MTGFKFSVGRAHGARVSGSAPPWYIPPVDPLQFATTVRAMLRPLTLAALLATVASFAPPVSHVARARVRMAEQVSGTSVDDEPWNVECVGSYAGKAGLECARPRPPLHPSSPGALTAAHVRQGFHPARDHRGRRGRAEGEGGEDEEGPRRRQGPGRRAEGEGGAAGQGLGHADEAGPALDRRRARQLALIRRAIHPQCAACCRLPSPIIRPAGELRLGSLCSHALRRSCIYIR